MHSRSFWVRRSGLALRQVAQGQFFSASVPADIGFRGRPPTGFLFPGLSDIFHMFRVGIWGSGMVLFFGSMHFTQEVPKFVCFRAANFFRLTLAISFLMDGSGFKSSGIVP